MTGHQRRHAHHTFVQLVAVLFLFPVTLSAQTGVLQGRVIDSATRAPLAAANIQIVGLDIGPITTDESGQFRATLAAGTYSIVVSRLGYESMHVDAIVIRDGALRSIAIRLPPAEVVLNPVVISASRKREKALDAPAAISVVSSEVVVERASPTPAEHMKALPGVDVAQSGLTQSSVVARGFNNAFSGALLTLTDYRYAHLPSLRLNAYHMIPTTDLDVDRIEVSRGPGSALYGPNAANGVMHLLTKSPISFPGTEISLAGGERSVFHGTLRHASSFNDRVGFKLSGQYFRGDDWEFTDPFEEAARMLSPGNPRIGNRDFNTERWSGEARMDVRITDRTDLVLSGGVNRLAGVVELTGVGAGQIDGWRYSYAQARLSHNKFFSQFFLNASDAGNSFLLLAADDIVDNSIMYGVQLQHGVDIGEAQSFVYGVDLQRTLPRTMGTITGRNEGNDHIDEVGGYLHSETRVSNVVDFVAALRVDYHNRLEDPNWSPRGAVVFHPGDNHTLRFTFNRAFSTPTTNNLFLDRLTAKIPIPNYAVYDVSVLGVPEGGFSFPTCAGGVKELCMRTPLAPGVELPADATVLWDSIVIALAPQLAPLLPNPGSQVQTILRRFSQEGAAAGDPFPVDPSGPIAIAPLTSTKKNTFEVGYKGLVGNRLLLAADVYYTRITDLLGPLRVETPSAFLDPTTTAAYVNQQLDPLVMAGAIEQADVDALIAGLVQIPAGTIAPTENPQPDILLTYRNFGDFDVWGADFFAQVFMTEILSLTGTLSLVNDDCFDANNDGQIDCTTNFDIALNAPSLKGSFGLRVDDPAIGVSFDGRMRYVDAFPMHSGIYVGEIDSYTVFDANVSFRLPTVPNMTLSVTATNLLDNRHREFIGAPELGRLVLGRVRVAF